MKLTDEQIRDLFEAWDSNEWDRVDKLHVSLSSRPVPDTWQVSTIYRPNDYTSLIDKAVLVRDDDIETWIARVLKERPYENKYITHGGFPWKQCIPFDPDKVGKT